ncbi:MAG: DUF1376 domain-containing protein [Eubacteriales bacterium]|nr:DUF1376 domain-containing protein [Eubacteriales bacterium]
MAKDPAFLFYSTDFYEGTRTMLPEERACYVDLMIYQHQRGPIPNDLQRVLLYCNGISEATLKATLQAKFKLTDKGWLNIKLQEVIEQRQEYSEKQSINGTIGQFWKKAKAILSANDYTTLYKSLSKKEKKELFEIIKDMEVSEATLKAMLKASLKHLENEIENEIENNIEIEKDSLKEKEREHIKEPEFAIHHKKLEAKKTWRTDFETYLSELNSVYDCLSLDQDFIRQQEEFYPEVDIVLSLKKSYTNFWGTEAGWKHKKKQKSKDIDWKATLTNAIGMNKVYKPKQPVQRKGTSLSQMQQIMDEVNNQKKLIHGI